MSLLCRLHDLSEIYLCLCVCLCVCVCFMSGTLNRALTSVLSACRMRSFPLSISCASSSAGRRSGPVTTSNRSGRAEHRWHHRRQAADCIWTQLLNNKMKGSFFGFSWFRFTLALGWSYEIYSSESKWMIFKRLLVDLLIYIFVYSATEVYGSPQSHVVKCCEIWHPGRESCTLGLMIRIFTIMYNVLQHYYDKQCSPESWNLLLTSLLAEISQGACALRQSKSHFSFNHSLTWQQWRSMNSINVSHLKRHLWPCKCDF